MTAPLWNYVALLSAHWIGDFVLQSRWMAENKSKQIDALAAHVAVYSAVIWIAAGILFQAAGPWRGLQFVAVNAVLHFATDSITSRITSRLWKKQRWQEFFLIIGLDQWVHHVTLAATMVWFFG